MGNYIIFRIIFILTLAVLSSAQIPDPVPPQYNGINCNGRKAVCVGPLSYLSCEFDIDENYRSVGAMHRCAPGTRCVNDNIDICVPFHLPTSNRLKDNLVNALHKISTEAPSSSTVSALPELATTTQLYETTLFEQTTTEEVDLITEYITDSYTDKTIDTKPHTTQKSENSGTYDIEISAPNHRENTAVPLLNREDGVSVNLSAVVDVFSNLNTVDLLPLNPIILVDAIGTIDKIVSTDSSVNRNNPFPSSPLISTHATGSLESVLNNISGVALNPLIFIDNTVSGTPLNPSVSFDADVFGDTIDKTISDVSSDPTTLVHTVMPVDSIDNTVTGLPSNLLASVDVTISDDSSGKTLFALPLNPPTSLDHGVSVDTIDSTVPGLPLNPPTPAAAVDASDSISNTVPGVPLNPPTLVDAEIPEKSIVSTNISVNKTNAVVTKPFTSVDATVSGDQHLNATVSVYSIGDTFPGVPLNPPTSLDVTVSVDSINGSVPGLPFNPPTPAAAGVAFDSISNTVPGVPLNPLGSLDLTDSIDIAISVNTQVNRTLSIPAQPLSPVNTGVRVNSNVHSVPAVLLDPKTSFDAEGPVNNTISTNVSNKNNAVVAKPFTSVNVTGSIDKPVSDLPLNPPISLNATLSVHSIDDAHWNISPSAVDLMSYTSPNLILNLSISDDPISSADSPISDTFKKVSSMSQTPFTFTENTSLNNESLIPNKGTSSVTHSKQYSEQKNEKRTYQFGETLQIKHKSDKQESQDLSDQSIDSKEEENISYSNILGSSEEISNELSRELWHKSFKTRRNDEQDNTSSSNDSISRTHQNALKTVLKALKDNCKADDIIPNPSNCNKYFRCIRKNSSKTKLEHLRCDDHQNFDAYELKCKLHGNCITTIAFLKNFAS